MYYARISTTCTSEKRETPCVTLKNKKLLKSFFTRVRRGTHRKFRVQAYTIISDAAGMIQVVIFGTVRMIVVECLEKNK